MIKNKWFFFPLQDQLWNCCYFNRRGHEYEWKAGLWRRMVRWGVLHSQRWRIYWFWDFSSRYSKFDPCFGYSKTKKDPSWTRPKGASCTSWMKIEIDLGIETDINSNYILMDSRFFFFFFFFCTPQQLFSSFFFFLLLILLSKSYKNCTLQSTGYILLWQLIYIYIYVLFFFCLSHCPFFKIL